MKEKKFSESFNAAIEGVVYVLQTQRNMRIHFLITFLIILVGIYLHFTFTELLLLCITIAMVLAAEVVNTAIELIVNMVQAETHPVAKVTKDVAAGAVLITSVNAIIVGYLLFLKKTPFTIKEGMAQIRHLPWHITFISLTIVFGLVILGKLVFYKGSGGFVRGGMPSGHSALAFSMWVAVTFITKNEIAASLSFIMAFLIARYRVKEYVHSLWEVVAGAMMGTLVTAIIFKLFL